MHGFVRIIASHGDIDPLRHGVFQIRKRPVVSTRPRVGLLDRVVHRSSAVERYLHVRGQSGRRKEIDDLPRQQHGIRRKSEREPHVMRLAERIGMFDQGLHAAAEAEQRLAAEKAEVELPGFAVRDHPFDQPFDGPAGLDVMSLPARCSS